MTRMFPLLLSKMILAATTILILSQTTATAFTPALQQQPFAPKSRSTGLQQRGQTSLYMGLLDDFKNRFLEDREGDFIRLDDDKEDQQEFGPGPLLVLYNVPAGVTNDEIQDMLSDGAPKAFQKGVTLYRMDTVNTSNEQDPHTDIMDNMSMTQALEGMASGKFQDNYKAPQIGELQTTVVGMPPPTCVTFFSGFQNKEMMATYNILANEIYQEAQISTACAKAVPNAMEKPLGQVLDEIGGDHRDAMGGGGGELRA